jgi:murein DD-endopeptidase MepM/ murein hydrolase activator NlpD
MESMAAFRSHTTREYSVKPGDTFWGIARRNGINLQALMDANPDYLPRRLPVGARLFLPSGQDLAQAARHQDRFVFHWPVGGRITSRYGWRWGRMHQGMDIAAPIGTLVRASAAGKVVFAGWRSGYGLMVIMVHANGWRTGYAHNSRLFVHPGEWVPDGGVLARVGATGHATGVHVHFEVIDGKGHVDPLRVLL